MNIIRDRARTFDLDNFLARPLFAHLSTTCDEGPRDSPVWFHWDGSYVWIIGDAATDSFPKRITKDGRSALGIIDYDRLTGRVEHVGMRGRATVEVFDIGVANALLSRYLGRDSHEWDERFREVAHVPTSLLIKFAPNTVVVRDVSYKV